MKSKEPKALEESLIDLYLNVKVRKQEEVKLKLSLTIIHK